MLPHWTENDIQVNGVQIHYYRTGSGEKPPIVLLHGFSDNGLCWLPTARDLEEDWDVILPDARGHGKSARVSPGELVDSADDVAGLARALELNMPVVGGHSMGGNTAGLIGARYPEHVRAIILEDPGWRSAPPPAPEGDDAKGPPSNPWLDWLLKVKDVPVEKIMEKGRKDSPTWAEVELRPWAESKQQLDLNVLKVINARMDWEEVARKQSRPTLLITGDVELGAIVLPETARLACEYSSAIKVVNVPGVGHNIRRENYPTFLRIVRQFLKDLPR